MKVLIISDNGVPSGYGRIADSVSMRLHKRGIEVMALSYMYDGILPAQYDGEVLPYHVGSIQNRPDRVQMIGNVAATFRADIVLGIQDFPYHVELFTSSAIDWSLYGRVLITPVDGTPIFPDWLTLLDHMDGALTISQFGVDAFADAGYSVGLCRPGVDVNYFRQLPPDERRAIRAKLGLTDEHFVLGTAAQNQGRKSIDHMLMGFFEFAKDKPHARYLMDMDEISPAGLHIPHVCKQQGWDASKLIYRSDAVRAGVVSFAERLNALDAHTVLARREGYGLPLAEAMACGVVSMAQDYCSGPEIVGDGRGCLIATTDTVNISGWGGAIDKHTDLADFVRQLNWLHDNPHERLAMAQRGMQWAREQTWDKATDNVLAVLERVYQQRQARREQQTTVTAAPVVSASPTPSPDATKPQELRLIEATQ